MTEQTVSVPLELLKRLFDNTVITRDVVAGDSVDVRPGALGALIDIKSFMPTPPKVGDTVVSIEGLPAGTVLRDNTDDLWLIGPDESLSYLDPAAKKPEVWPIVGPAWQTYQPVIIALPRD